MAIYRESPPIWRRSVAILGVVFALILIALIVVIVIASSRPTPPITGPKAIQQKLDELTTWLEQFDIEYRKIQPGTDKSQTGAPGALQNALDIYSSITPDLQKVDAAQAAALKQELDLLKSKLDEAAVDPDLVSSTVATATTHIQSLSQDLQPTQVATP